MYLYTIVEQCRKHEVFKVCPGCPPTCQKGKPAICLLPCTFKCVCMDSYIKDEVSGKCVETCHQKSTTESTTTVIVLTPSHDDNPRNGTLHHLRGLHWIKNV